MQTRNFLATLVVGFSVILSLAGAVTVFGGLTPEQKPQLW